MEAGGIKEKFRGSLLGLAAGDALGASIEFMPPGTFEPVINMRGGGTGVFEYDEVCAWNFQDQPQASKREL